MNEDYLIGLHEELKIEHDYEVWKDAMQNNPEYSAGLHE